MKTTIVLAALLALAACAPVIWDKPGGTQSEFDRDARECQYDANKATAGVISGMEAGWQKASLYQQCMELRGYVRRVK